MASDREDVPERWRFVEEGAPAAHRQEREGCWLFLEGRRSRPPPGFGDWRAYRDQSPGLDELVRAIASAQHALKAWEREKRLLAALPVAPGATHPMRARALEAAGFTLTPLVPEEPSPPRFRMTRYDKAPTRSGQRARPNLDHPHDLLVAHFVGAFGVERACALAVDVLGWFLGRTIESRRSAGSSLDPVGAMKAGWFDRQRRHCGDPRRARSRKGRD